MVDARVVDQEVTKLSNLATQGINEIQTGPQLRETYEHARKAFGDELRTLEKNPELLKEVAAKSKELHTDTIDGMEVITDKDGNITAITARSTGKDPVYLGAVVLPPKQREIVDKLEDALVKQDQTQVGAQASALHKEVIRSFETKDVYTIGNLDQTTDAYRTRFSDIMHYRVNPDVLARGSQESIQFFPPDNFVIGGEPWFASVGNRKTKEFEYFVKKDGTIPTNWWLIGAFYGKNQDPGTP